MDRRLAVALAAALLLLPAGARAGDDPPAEKVSPDETVSPDAEAKRPAPTGKAAKDGKAAQAPAPAEGPLVRQRTPRSRKEALKFLEGVTVDVTFEGATVGEVVRWLSVVSGVNVILGPGLLKEVDVELLKVDLRLRRVTVRQVLDLVAKSHSLAIGYRNGIVLLTTVKEARGKPVLRLYTVADLAMPIRDFPGPDLMLRPAGAEFEPEQESVTKQAFSDADEILELVRDNTGTGTWGEEGVSGDVMRDWLVIRQYPDVHEEIADLLARLRAHR